MNLKIPPLACLFATPDARTASIQYCRGHYPSDIALALRSKVKFAHLNTSGAITAAHFALTQAINDEAERRRPLLPIATSDYS